MGLQCVKVGLNRRQGGAQIACRWGWGDDFCNLLRPFGITNNYTGCSQLIRAVKIVLEKPDGIQAVHKQIYAVIAKEYDLQPRSVESNIRTLSDIAWKNDPARLVQIAGYPLDNRPSAVQFIEIFSNYIQRNYLEERILT